MEVVQSVASSTELKRSRLASSNGKDRSNGAKTTNCFLLLRSRGGGDNTHETPLRLTLYADEQCSFKF